MVTTVEPLDLQSMWCVMSHYNDLLFRALLAISMTWILASIFHNQQKEQMQKQYRETLNNYLQENRRLRTQNADLSYELSKLKDKK